MKVHLLLLFLQASLPNSLLGTSQLLFHKLLKAFRQKVKLGGMLLGWAALLVLMAPFPKSQDVTVFVLPSIFPCSLPAPHSTWLLHCNLFSQKWFLSEYAGTRSVASDCLLSLLEKNRDLLKPLGKIILITSALEDVCHYRMQGWGYVSVPDKLRCSKESNHSCSAPSPPLEWVPGQAFGCSVWQTASKHISTD